MPDERAGERAPVADETSNGVRTIVLPHWRAFHELMIAKEMLRSGLIWRGQRRGWALRPRLERDFPPPNADPVDPNDPFAGQRREVEEKNQWLLRYAAQLQRFKSAAAGRRGVNPRNLDGPKDTEDEDDEWWALGQHYGLHTPLLDWTDSPFAALFFAFVEDSSAERLVEPMGQHYRSVFALDHLAIEFHNVTRLSNLKDRLQFNPVRVPAHDPDNRESVARARATQERMRRERLEFPKIRVVRPTTDENLRLLSQGGVFTQAPPGKDVESFIRENFKDEIASPIMLKVHILEDDPRDCLIALNRMGINHRTLFPDLSGASLFVNRSIDDPQY